MSHILKLVSAKSDSQLASKIIIGVSTIYISFYGVANTFLVHQYQNIFTAYENDKPIPVSDKIKKRFNEVMDDLKLEDHLLATSKVYSSIRPSLSHVGLMHSKFGVRIGVPLSFNYDSKADINRNMKIESKVVDWNSEEGKILEDSLILSEKAQKFALAQEIFKCSSIYFYASLIYPFVGLFIAYFTGIVGKEKFQLARKPVQARGVFYALSCLFAYGVYVLLEDKSQMLLERYTLSAACSLGTDYIEGGIEYFDKQLKTNRALRNLLHDGVDTIAVTGNYNYFIRQKSLPLTYQKKFFEGKLKELQSNTEKVE